MKDWTRRAATRAVTLVAITAAATVVVGQHRAESTAVVLASSTKHTFTVTGGVKGLAPGVARPLNLSITNPDTSPLRVDGVTVSLGSSSTKTCSATRNFTILQLNSQAYPLTIPAKSTRTLSQLGVTSSRWPQVRMYDLLTNQDGCKHAVIGLKYIGVGRGGTK